MTAPIITVTLNPAIDQTVSLDHLVPGKVHRARAVRFDAGGKGVNVASCLADWGAPVAVTGVLGDGNDQVFKALFAAKGIDDRFLRVAGETRINIKLVHDDDTTDINLPGLTVPPATLDALIANLTAAVTPGSVVVLAGSLPNGVDASVYRDLIGRLAPLGVRVVLDTSGTPLTLALRPDAPAPYAIKPNRTELEAWAGHPLPDRAALMAAAEGLLAQGLKLVIVSLGAEGALFVSGEGKLMAVLPVVSGASTVGAGDAMVAGLVSGLTDGLPLDALARRATAFAVGKLGRPGPNLPPPGDIARLATQVTLTRL